MGQSPPIQQLMVALGIVAGGAYCVADCGQRSVVQAGLERAVFAQAKKLHPRVQVAWDPKLRSITIVRLGVPISLDA